MPMAHIDTASRENLPDDFAVGFRRRLTLTLTLCLGVALALGVGPGSLRRGRVARLAECIGRGRGRILGGRVFLPHVAPASVELDRDEDEQAVERDSIARLAGREHDRADQAHERRDDQELVAAEEGAKSLVEFEGQGCVA